MTDDRSDSYKGSPHAAPYPLSRLSARIDLVAIATEIESAHSMIAAVAGAKLETIADQIRALQARAAEVLERAQHDAQLHRAVCRFRKQPGKVYHLYREPDGGLYFSLLSPADWRGQPPHTFAGSFRLEADQRWTPFEEIEDRDRDRAAIRGLLD